MMKENSKAVLNYLKSVNGQADVTANDVAAALGLNPKQVNGIFTRCIQMKDLGSRVPREVELEDGKHKEVKFLVLNEAGLAFDPDADVEE